MKHETKTQLDAIAQHCEKEKGIFNPAPLNLERIWKEAGRYRKLQVNATDQNEVIKELNFYVDASGEIQTKLIRAKKDLSRLQWFALIYMHESFCTYEATKEVLNTISINLNT